MNNQVQSGRSVSLADIRKAYDSEVMGRRFVEDLDYYQQSRRRFEDNIRRIAALGLPEGARALDIGGGITGVLMDRLLGFDVTVADVIEDARADVEALGLGFTTIDLFRDGPPPVQDLDLVVLQEVIEHIPQPPYIVFERIARLLKPGGRLFLTTPNGNRFRNIVYMLMGRDILDLYRYPEEGQGLGHQHEYTMKQLLWQSERAGFAVEEAEFYDDGWRGATPGARAARNLMVPANIVPFYRNAITMTLRAPA